MDSHTNVFNVKELRQELILMTVNDVVSALKEKGYNPTNQLVGYLTTGDDKFITTYANARFKLLKYDRTEVLMAILNSYMGL